MHPALKIPEILMYIFSGSLSCNISRRRADDPFTLVQADLAALARTCRTFKELALDILWSDLDNLDPLVLCLPEVCIQVPRDRSLKDWYKLRRPLTQDEWDILRSYARRIRSVRHLEGTFHPDCVEALLSHPTPDPLFQNLRHVCCTFANKANPFLRHPLPSLISLDYSFCLATNISVYRDSLAIAQNVTRLSMGIVRPRFTSNDPIGFGLDPAVDRVVSDAICRWSDLRVVSCGHFALTLDAIRHLSRAENLARLSFTLEVTLLDLITSFDVPICFRKLQDLEVLCSGPSTAVSKLLSHLHLSSITDLTVKFDGLPSKEDVKSFLDVLQKSGIGSTIQKFGFVHDCHTYRSNSLSSYIVEGSAVDTIDYNDLRPIMAFRNLRVLDFNVRWDVGLTGEDLMVLASAWPYLEELSINRVWGWQSNPFALCQTITPEEVVRLLRTRPFLKKLSLNVDMRNAVIQRRPPPIDFTDLPPGIVEIDVLDTTIYGASITAMVSLLTHLIPTGRPLLTLYKGRDYWASGWQEEEVQYWDDLSDQLQLAYSTSRELTSSA